MADKLPPETSFEARMRRIQQSFDEASERHTRFIDEWVQQSGGRRAYRDARRESRRQRREARRGRPASTPQAIVYAVMAVVALVMALRLPHLWWLFFVALGLGLNASRQFSTLAQQRELDGAGARDDEGEREEAPPPRRAPPQREAPPAIPEADAKVNAVCDKLLAEVRAGPNLLREVVRNPEQTVETLRKSCHELSRRERDLRALFTPEDERRLSAEREALAARVEAEPDAVAKGRLTEALAALDAQRRQRAELSVSASRLGAEHTRLYYTLESLYAQVLRVRSADAGSADVAGTGLRHSLEQLGQEMDAVAEALESVHTAQPPGGRERL